MSTAASAARRRPTIGTRGMLAALVLVGGAVMAVVGIPNVPLMWPMYRFGIVLPSCGLTRGVVEIFRGDFARAWRFNPASFVVVGASALVLAAVATRYELTQHAEASPLLRRVVAIALGAALIVLWINQQLHAEFVMHGRV